MLNPKIKDDMRTLQRHVKRSFEDLNDSREGRLEAMEQYLGPYYSNQVLQKVDHRPLNVIELGVNILQGLLVPSMPRALITGRGDALLATAKRLTIANNQIAQEINLEETINKCVLNSFFSLTFARIYVCQPKEYEYRAFGHPDYTLRVDYIPYDDMVFDFEARSWEELRYIGHRYRVSEEYVLKNKAFSQKAKDTILNSKPEDINAGGDKRTYTLSQGTTQHKRNDQIEPFYDLWCIYAPREKKLFHFADGDTSGEMAMVKDYDGPIWGPYIPLQLMDAPDNLIPLTPKDTWMSTQKAVNDLLNKVIKQEINRIDVFAFPHDAQQEATDLIANADGRYAFKMQNPAALNNFRTQGMDQSSFGLMTQLFNLWQANAGNINLLGGMSANSETATQDQMLLGGASRRVLKMQNRVTNFSRRIYETMTWYLTHDKKVNIPISREIERGITVHHPMTKDEVYGTFEKWNFEIDPYSGQDMTPAKRLGVVKETFGMLMQMAPYLMQQGKMPNIDEYMEILAQYSGAPEIKRLITDMQGGSQESEQPISVPGQTTTRRYERINKSAGQNDPTAAIMQGLRGAGQQGNQMNMTG